MVNYEFNDFDMIDSEFNEKTAEEMYEEFLGSTEPRKDEFIYIYSSYLSVMPSLTGAAMDLFMWLTSRCNVNSGRAFVQSITLKDCLKELGITLGTYYKALNLLKEKNLIKGGNATYYVNPVYGWKGTADRRAKFLKIYPRLKSEELARK